MSYLGESRRAQRAYAGLTLNDLLFAAAGDLKAQRRAGKALVKSLSAQKKDSGRTELRRSKFVTGKQKP